jgi:hypothetical protein
MPGDDAALPRGGGGGTETHLKHSLSVVDEIFFGLYGGSSTAAFLSRRVYVGMTISFSLSRRNCLSEVKDRRVKTSRVSMQQGLWCIL